MSITVEGTIEKVNLGAGAWVIKSSEQTYELFKPPSDLLKPGASASIKGEIRNDVMTTAMVGPVLEVKEFELK